jgi:hypothetical protein
MVIFVHGIGADKSTWGEVTEGGGFDLSKGDKWMKYFKTTFGIPSTNMVAYSLSAASGWHGRNMLEVGGIGYKSEASNAEAENNQSQNGKKRNTGIQENRNMIQQAVWEYKTALKDNKNINIGPDKKRRWENSQDVPDNYLPSKIVFVTHSQGNYAVRGYLHSLALHQQGYFDQSWQGEEVVPKSLWPEQAREKAKGNESKETGYGNYTYPVEKVVYVSPTLRGSTMRRFSQLNMLRMLKGIKEQGTWLSAGVKAEIERFDRFMVGGMGKPGTAGGDPGSSPMRADLSWEEIETYLSEIKGWGAINQAYMIAIGKKYLNRSKLMEFGIGIATQHLKLGALAIPFPGMGMWVVYDGVASLGNNGIIRDIVPLILEAAILKYSEKSVSPRDMNVGDEGTEKALRDLRLDTYLKGEEAKRKWQPKYAIVAPIGSVALNKDETLAEYEYEWKGMQGDYFGRTLRSDKFWKASPSRKLEMALFSGAGGIFTEEGDIIVSEGSLRGDGVKELEGNTTGAHIFRDELSEVDGVLDGMIKNLAVVEGLCVSLASPPPAWMCLRLAVIVDGLWKIFLNDEFITTIIAEPAKSKIRLHNVINDQVTKYNYAPYMDKSLFENPVIKIQGIYGEIGEERWASSNLAANQKPAKVGSRPEENWAGAKESWPSYEQMAMSSENRGVVIPSGKRFFQQTEVKKEAGPKDSGLVWMVDNQGQEFLADAALVTGNTVLIRGQLMDFVPKLAKLAYSYNFSGYSPIKVINDYGHFELGPLALSEGQNLMTFKAQNKAGYSSTQTLKFIKTGISVQPVLDAIYPKPDSVVNTGNFMLKLAFQNMRYSDKTATQI